MLSRLPSPRLLAVLAGLGLASLPHAAAALELDRQATNGIPPKGDRVAGPNLAAFRTGMDALAAGAVEQARAVRDGLAPDGLDRHILTWAIALKGGPGVPSSDLADASRSLADWPGMATLKRNTERALWREQASPDVIVAALGSEPPDTVEGVRALARAYVALGRNADATRVISAAWRTETLEAADETAIMSEFGGLLTQADHRFRMERMLYAERPAAARRAAAHADAQPLCAAWIAVINGDKMAQKLLDSVPEAQRGPGYQFAKARLLRRSDKIDDAAAIMLAAPTDAASLVDPDAWWVERRALSRELADDGDLARAYKVASAHAAESSQNKADAEFHAGWFALRGLRDPAAASAHFARITDFAGSPTSLARAYYWLGRAADAGGPGDAKADYQRAAAFGTSFYGQLAAEKIGQSTLTMTSPEPSALDRARFGQRESVAAIRRLEAAGYPATANLIYRDLAGQLESPGELALLASLAEQRGNHFLALKVAKIAGARGLDIGGLSHPVGAIPDAAQISGPGKALAYAIARQESEFNPGAVSRAGALGLLQLMPETARIVAKKAGLVFSQARLITDAGYNATLGSAFLDEQLARFNGSYVLTFAGYNAGPRRAQDWIGRYGDPRGKDIDSVVDWIESIPYTETRNYVQRVMENFQAYKMRLTGRYDIVADLRSGAK